MSKLNCVKFALVTMLSLVFLTSNVKSQNNPSIKIDGNEILVSEISKFPIWLHEEQKLEIGSKVKFISVLEYEISPISGGGNNLFFISVINVTSLQTVPPNKVWKIESVGIDISSANIFLLRNKLVVYKQSKNQFFIKNV